MFRMTEPCFSLTFSFRIDLVVLCVQEPGVLAALVESDKERSLWIAAEVASAVECAVTAAIVFLLLETDWIKSQRLFYYKITRFFLIQGLFMFVLEMFH